MPPTAMMLKTSVSDRVFYDDDPLELHRIVLREAVDIMQEWKNKPDKIEY